MNEAAGGRIRRMATTKRKHIKIAKRARVIVKWASTATGCILMSR
jgi:hypothetical protein